MDNPAYDDPMDGVPQAVTQHRVERLASDHLSGAGSSLPPATASSDRQQPGPSRAFSSSSSGLVRRENVARDFDHDHDRSDDQIGTKYVCACCGKLFDELHDYEGDLLCGSCATREEEYARAQDDGGAW